MQPCMIRVEAILSKKGWFYYTNFLQTRQLFFFFSHTLQTTITRKITSFCPFYCSIIVFLFFLLFIFFLFSCIFSRALRMSTINHEKIFTKATGAGNIHRPSHRVGCAIHTNSFHKADTKFSDSGRGPRI